MAQVMAFTSALSPNLRLGCSTCIAHSSPPEVRHRQLIAGKKRGDRLFISTLAGIEDSSRAPAAWCIQPIRRAKRHIVAASSNEGDETKSDASEAPRTSESLTEAAKPAISEKRAQAEAEMKKGQRTAIVTGAISVLLGFGYLVLIQLLDTRGVILVPPPPEAFNP